MTHRKSATFAIIPDAILHVEALVVLLVGGNRALFCLVSVNKGKGTGKGGLPYFGLFVCLFVCYVCLF